MYKIVYVFLILLLHSKILAFSCDGDFQQNIVVENEEWSWTYSTKNNSVSGETLLHAEHNSFTIIGSENVECLNSGTCSSTDTMCAVSLALLEPSKSKLSTGRIHMISYGLYILASDIVKELNDCDRAYSEYYLEVERIWQQQLLTYGEAYEVIKVQPREIKIDKPPELENKCFESRSIIPKMWFGIDYFPVVKVERVK